MLLATVRDQGRMLHELMSVAEDNARAVRDRAPGARPRRRRQRGQDALLRGRQPRPAPAAARAVDQRDHARHPGAARHRSAAEGSEPRHRQRPAPEQQPARRPARHLAPRCPYDPGPAFAPQDIGAVLRAAHDEYAALAAQQGLLPEARAARAAAVGPDRRRPADAHRRQPAEQRDEVHATGGITLAARARGVAARCCCG